MLILYLISSLQYTKMKSNLKLEGANYGTILGSALMRCTILCWNKTHIFNSWLQCDKIRKCSMIVNNVTKHCVEKCN